MPSLIRKRLALVEFLGQGPGAITVDDNFLRALRLRPEEKESKSMAREVLQELENDGFITSSAGGVVRFNSGRKSLAETTYVDHLAQISHHVSC